MEGMAEMQASPRGRHWRLFPEMGICLWLWEAVRCSGYAPDLWGWIAWIQIPSLQLAGCGPPPGDHLSALVLTVVNGKGE